MAEQDMFSGVVYCADCGRTMVLNRAHTMDSVKNNFMCSTYKKQGKEIRSAHDIRESQLAAIVLDDLRRVTHFARQQEALFVQHINQKNSAEAKHEIDRLQRELDAMKHRDTELPALFRRLYEDKVLRDIITSQIVACKIKKIARCGSVTVEGDCGKIFKPAIFDVQFQ